MTPADFRMADLISRPHFLLWTSCAGYRHFLNPDLRGFLGAAFLGIDGVGGEHKEGPATRATERASNRHRVELEAFGDFSALAHAEQLEGHRRGDPDGALGIE